MRRDYLLSEIERQKKYLAELPPDFEYPLFNVKYALESQRRSAYRSTAAAAREIIDNSLEAGSQRVHVVFDRPTERDREKYQQREKVSSIAFIDDGSGMVPDMIRYALSWGGGTHFEHSEVIGKFGFGLPNASINQTRRVEVYSRISKSEKFAMTYLDMDEFAKFGLQSVPKPRQARLPDFVQRYLDVQDWDLASGTIVVWVRPDRLSYRKAAPLKEHLVDDFGITYRYLLRDVEKGEAEKDVELVVEGIRVEMVDPLFLSPIGRYYVAPDQGGAILMEERSIPVKYFRDEQTGAVRLTTALNTAEIEDPTLLATGAIHVRISRLPVGFAEAKKARSAEVTDANRRFEIRKHRRGMSFVRANREIETVDAFPRSQRDIASGLGRWPLLQSYAYHWGVEVKFQPNLDEVFGITNDKQTVRPIEDFWRVLAEVDIDSLLHNENKWQREQRRKKPELKESPGPTLAEMAALGAETALGRRSRIPDRAKAAAGQAAEDEARRRVGVTASSIEEARKALELEAKRRPFKVEYVDDPRGPFYEPVWVGPQMVVRVNKQHPFFETLYGSLLTLPGGSLAKFGVDLMMITLARTELTGDELDVAELFKSQREFVWSPFLASGMRILTQTEFPHEEEAEEAA